MAQNGGAPGTLIRSLPSAAPYENELNQVKELIHTDRYTQALEQLELLMQRAPEMPQVRCLKGVALAQQLQPGRPRVFNDGAREVGREPGVDTAPGNQPFGATASNRHGCRCAERWRDGGRNKKPNTNAPAITAVTTTTTTTPRAAVTTTTAAAIVCWIPVHRHGRRRSRWVHPWLSRR